jgi:hypothetical protein
MLPRPRFITVTAPRLLARMLLLAACSGWALAADPPPVPDPLGLGERLALIDCLQETYRITPPIGETLDQLRARYAAAWTQAQAQTAEHRDADSAALRVDRLRRLISARFHQDADRALDEDGLLAELHRLERIQEDEDQVKLATLAASAGAAPHAPGSAPAPGSAAAPGTAPAPGSAAARPPAPAGRPPAPLAHAAPEVDVHLHPAMEALSDCWYRRSGDHTILMVTLGGDWNGALRGAPERVWDTFHRAKEIHRAVAIFGHGTGTGIAGLSIKDHLRKYQDFYESMGGQEAQEKLSCLLFASCSEGSADQIAEMRNGLGYYPTWRIAAGARVAMNIAVFLGALRGIMDLPAEQSYRGVYRFGTNNEFAAAFGEVGVDGERANPVNVWVDGAGSVIPGR